MKLVDFLEGHARLRPDSVFAVHRGGRLSYAEAAARMEMLAGRLAGLGVRAGDRFAVLSRNSPDMVLLFLAASRLGAVPVPLNFRLSAREIAHIVHHAGARVVLAQAEFAPALGWAEEGRHVLVALGDACPPGWRPLADLPVGEAGLCPAGDLTPAYQMYTSGTTGLPKGVCISHAAVLTSVTQYVAALGEKPGTGDGVLVVAPMFHAAAALLAFIAVHCGATLVVHEEFSPAAVVSALASGAVQVTALVPAMIRACVEAHAAAGAPDCGGLRVLIYGGSPIAPAELNAAMRAFPCRFLQAYGMTESTAGVTFLTEQDHARALVAAPGLLKSAGRPLPGVALRILDAAGAEAPAGTPGEICIRSPQVMTEYWNDPAATAAALADGWLRTGDIGYLDGDGYLYVCDRKKDMIISGGENIYPAEVEAVLLEHPDVREAAVIGVADARWGETPLAFVVLRLGAAADGASLEAFCRRHLAAYKVPRLYEFAQALPRNASGKVLKQELRAARRKERVT
ncbi:MAG TPA: long-chain-fatty-acid--CoA ligase [Azospirillaceae bacterium]|nr:long-chain-fatty-acid--CoA ligase [Azospirillaceae bacterium]